MLVSYNWLKTLIEFDLTVHQVSDLLTNTGLEVEKVHETESVSGGLKGLKIGSVITCEKHPDADRLSVTTVDVGDAGLLQIVCGAPNVAVGQRVVVATVGCFVHPTNGEAFEIKKAKIRGVHSEGMICAEDEIGLGKGHEGILVLPNDAPIGTLASHYFEIETDFQIEIGLTPNRGDAASHLGVARDIKAVTGRDVKMSPTKVNLQAKAEGKIADFSIELLNPEMCPRYTGILLKNVKVGKSPNWLKQRLKSIDLKPINNVVDVTNFVLHEVGQPIHAFDADKVANKTIQVRPSMKGEKMTTLDGIERTLTGNELLIADTEKALAIAGVFGGLHSGVTKETTSVFIESAYFDMGTIRKSAKSQGLNTDASFRYERGCDPEITVYALQRVVDLLSETSGAEIASEIMDVYPTKIESVIIDLDTDWLNVFCGTQIDIEAIKNILLRLDFQIIDQQSNLLKLKAPLYRSDVTRPVDVAEEVLRIYGYNQVELPSQLRFTPAVAAKKSMLEMQHKLARFLNGQGFLEIMNNSQNRKEDADENAVQILNPLSAELAVMRTSLLPGALTAVGYNINRKNKDLLFYEFGKTYIKRDENFIEIPKLLLVSTGNSNQKNWITPAQKADYYFMSGIVDGIADCLGISSSKAKKAVTIEVVDAKRLKTFDVKQEVISADINLDSLLKLYLNSSFKLQEIPIYPIVERDISAVVDMEVAFKEISRIVTETCGKYFRSVDVFDVYQGDRLPNGKKSYAFSIELYDNKQTMTDKVTDGIISKLIKNLETKVGATIRK